MDVRCDKCGTEYEFDEARIGPSGVTVKCTACGYVFRVKKPALSRASSSPRAREWLVKRPDGQIIAFRELTTLQKWIVEGRIARDDEISKNGETWKRLGNIGELEPFFSVFERAKALNELMTTGAIGERPIVVNGSEVLATMSPLSSIVAASSPIPPDRTAPAEPVAKHLDEIAARAQASLAGSVPPGTPRRASVPPRPPTRSDRTRGPSMVTRRPELAGFESLPQSSSLPGIPDARTEESMPALRAEPVNGRPLSGLPLARSVTPPPSDDIPLARSLGDTRLELKIEGPGSLRGSLPARGGHNFDQESSEIVRSFGRHRRQQRVLISLLAFVLLGFAGGAGFALLGPQANPLQKIAQKYGLIPATAPVPDPAEPMIDAARRAFELDTPASLTTAEAGLEDAIVARPTDSALRAELALVLATHTDALRRSAAEDDRRAEATAEPEAAQALRLGAEAKRKQASALVKRAFESARQAYEADPAALEPARAFAEYYRVQRDPSGHVAQMLAIAKTAAHAQGTTDAPTLYIEAADMVRDLTGLQPADLERATRLLEEALTLRPTLLRARVLLARILIARGLGPLAATELRRTLEASPEHDEAKRLLELAAPPSTPITVAPDAGPAAGARPSGASVAQALPVPSERQKEGATATAASPKPQGTGALKLDHAPPENRGFEAILRQADRARERGAAQDALALYERAAALHPSSGRAYAGMGWAYLDMGKAEAAIHQFRKTIAVDAGYSDGHLGHAEAYRALGNTEKAVASYRRYLQRVKTGPGAEAARRAIAALGGSEEPAEAPPAKEAAAEETPPVPTPE